MPVRRRSLISRIFHFLAFRLVPMLLLVGIIWSGYQIAGAVARQFNERSALEGRDVAFAQIATEIASVGLSTEVPLTMTFTSEPTAVNASSSTDAPTETPKATSTEVVSPTRETITATDIPDTATLRSTATRIPATETPQSTATDTPNTATTRPTETPKSTATLIPPTDTPQPIATETVENNAQSDAPLPVAQLFVTNTPQRAVFATNTPQGGSGETQPTAIIPSETATAMPTTVPTFETPQITIATVTPSPTITPSFAPTNTPEPTLEPTPPPVASEPTRALPTLIPASLPEAGAISNGTLVPTIVPTVERAYNLVNIILLGGDDGLTDDNFNRTDTMLIVSINRDTGTVSMLSLPRDLYVYIPSGTMQRLNIAYAVGDSIDWSAGGFGLLRETILYNFGINVHYYVRVNFDSFAQIIDSVDGIDIAVDCAYQDYPLIDTELPDGVIEDPGADNLVTLPVGYYHMSGPQALWYARTRNNSSDFDRGRRQQQIIRAIWRRVIASGQLDITNLPNLWQQATSVVETDLQLDDIIGLLPIALNLDVSGVESFTLVRTYHTTPWQTPDGDFVQLPIYETLRPLLEDFYRPPTDSQIVIEGATISILNGTGNNNWDRVAAERLGYEGFLATADGAADTATYDQTILVDHTGRQKGSSLSAIAQLLNVTQENIRIEPDPNRTSDFEVILGADYNSCSGEAVVAVEGQ